MSKDVRFSIVIPVYNSHTTLQRCLEGVRKLDYTSFEVILVDSSPDERSFDIIKCYPEYTGIRSVERLWMHEAKNVGIRSASGEIIACLDPDCVPDPDWLTRLEESLKEGYHVVGGGMGFYPGRPIDLAAHILKFWRWFPFSGVRIVEDLPTANIAFDRGALNAGGLFGSEYISGDTELCYRLRRHGFPNYLNGEAVVRHIHEVTFMSLMKERFTRGIDFALMRASTPEWNRLLSVVAIVAMPLLALRQFYWKFKASSRHGYLRGFLRMPHVILCGDFAWMTGVAIGKARSLFRPTPQE